MQNIKYIPFLNIKCFTGISYELLLSSQLLYNCVVNKPDVIYLRQNCFPFLPVILCKIFKISSIIEINGLIYDELLMNSVSKSFVSKMNYHLSIKSEKFNYNYCDKIISVTSKIKEEIIKIYDIPENKIVVINNGANIELFKPLVKQEALNKLNLDSSYIYICFVGNLSPWQGVEYLIKAAPLILNKYVNTRFLVVGDGILKKELKQLAGDLDVLDKFLFIGSVSYEIVPIYINAADICVVPKKPLLSGYSPLKLYEYMACGKPIVATNTNGFELLEKINAGILVNSESPTEFANSIITLLENPKLMSDMGKNGRIYVVEKHSWDSIARKVLDVCNDVIIKN